MDDASIVGELRRVTPTDSRELDRVCEEVAAALVTAGREPSFDVTSADFATDPHLICADRYWFRRFAARPEVATAAACARWLREHAAPEHRHPIEPKWALGYGFVTRGSVESRNELAEATERIVGADSPTGDVAYFATLYHAGKLRANLHFDELYRFLESSLLAMAAGAHRDEPLFVALQSFAAFGNRAITAEHAIDLLERAWTHPDRTRHVTDVCLNGLARAAPFDGHGELLRDRAAQAVAAHPDDDVFRYRLATGQLLCGEHDAALDTIDTALRLLPAIGARGSHELLQNQYIACRDAIAESRLRAVWTAEQQRRWDDQAATTAALQQSMQNSAVRAVELVAVFTAAIAFAVGSLQVTLSGTLSITDRLLLVTLLGSGLALFALIIVGGTWIITRRR